jgi:hypothetical protein
MLSFGKAYAIYFNMLFGMCIDLGVGRLVNLARTSCLQSLSNNG